VLAGGIIWLASKQEAALASQPPDGCKNEMILLDISRSAGPVVSVEKRGADIIAKVSWRSWVKITRQAQIGIAMAAYCPVAPADKRGIAHVVDEDGQELGRVVNGDWQSKLFSD
jgi:hypothetical protein